MIVIHMMMNLKERHTVTNPVTMIGKLARYADAPLFEIWVRFTVMVVIERGDLSSWTGTLIRVEPGWTKRGDTDPIVAAGKMWITVPVTDADSDEYQKVALTGRRNVSRQVLNEISLSFHSNHVMVMMMMMMMLNDGLPILCHEGWIMIHRNNEREHVSSSIGVVNDRVTRRIEWIRDIWTTRQRRFDGESNHAGNRRAQLNRDDLDEVSGLIVIKKMIWWRYHEVTSVYYSKWKEWHQRE